MDNKLLAIIIGSMLILGSGTTYVLVSTGKSSTCSTGWVFQVDGTNEGKYMCKTLTTTRYQYCSSVKDSSTKSAYYCDVAVPVQVAKQGNQWQCNQYECVPI